MSNLTLHIVPHHKAIKAVKRLFAAMIISSMIGSLPGVNLIAVLGDRALAHTEPEPFCRMEITKTGTPDEVAPGGEIRYTVKLKNTGTANCTGGGVELKEFYDPQTIFVSATPNPFQGNDLWNFGTVEPGEEHTITITVTAAEDAQDGDILTNKACVWAEQFGQHDDMSKWVCDEETTTVVNVPPPPSGFDLKLEKNVSPAIINVNQEATFTITVTNEGSVDGTGITVKDTMPSALTYVSDSTDGDYNRDTGVWTIGNLAAGESTSTSITVRAGSSGSFANVAEVLSANQTDIDSTPNNNVATEDDQDSAVLKVNELPGPPGGCVSNCGIGSPPFPKISIVKSVNKPIVNLGEIVTYTFTISAGGTEASQNARVTDTLPTGFTFIEGAVGIRTWDFGTMDEQTSKTESYDVLVGPSVAPGTYENVVVATITNGAAPANRSEARAKVEVQSGGGGGGGGPSGPQLTLQKFATTAFTNPDSQVMYNVTVKNISGVTAKNVTVEDTLPAGFTFVDGGTSTKVSALGDLAAGESRLLIYAVKVAVDVAAGFHKNFATARADNASPVSDDAEVEVRVVQVKGFTTLPDTGTGDVNPIAIAFAAFLMLKSGLFLAWRYRGAVREVVRERVLINFLARP